MGDRFVTGKILDSGRTRPNDVHERACVRQASRKKIRTTGGIAVSVLLALVAGLRPYHIDAILLHAHGDEGRHAHPLDLSSGESLEDRHLQLHDLEHHGSGQEDSSAHAEFAGDHDEDCSALVISFGEKHVAPPSPRDLTGSHAQAAVDADAALPLFLAAGIDGAPPPCPRTWNVLVVSRALDAILSTDSALRI